MKIDICKNCGDAITFATDRKKHRIVLNPDPVPGGPFHLQGVAAAPRAVSAPSSRQPGYVLHSTTCGNPPRRSRKRERVKSAK